MNDRVDRELFHAWLWENRGRRDMIEMTGAEIAKRLRLSPHTPTRLFNEFVSAGKLKKVRRGKYIVIDPEQTKDLNSGL